MKIELVSFYLCPFVHRSTTMLREKRVAFDIRYIDLADKPAWFLALSPRGKVPLLLVDGTPIFESSAINELLDELHPPRMLPEDPIERARQRGWVEVANDAFSAHYKMIVAASEPDFRAAAASLRQALERFEEVLRGAYFAGDRFGYVDVATAPALFRLKLLEKRTPLRAFEGLPKVAAWAERLAAHPSVVAGVVPDFEERMMRSLESRSAHVLRA